MIYKSLDILPFKVFLEIQKTGNVLLLTDDENPDVEKLNQLWAELEERHESINPGKEATKNLKISSQIEYFHTKYKSIIIACEALKFDVDEELVDMLREHGYKLEHKNYHEDISRIEKESNALLIKAERLKGMLPKNDRANETTVDEVMASYSLILGFDFDYNTISVLKFYALEKQVSAKIKHLENAK